MERAVAVFDLEGTLFKRSNSFMREMRHSFKRGFLNKVNTLVFNIILMMVFLCYKIHLVGELRMRTFTIKRMATLIKDSTEKEISQRATIFAVKYTNLLRPEINRILQDHKTKGHTTILFSGMLLPYVEAVKQELGIDIAIGTELEIKEGYYTGRLSRVPYFAKRRAQALRELTDKLDYKINLSKSFAYGDAILDKFFMDMVGNPVAVHPDKKLTEYAKGHGWSIVI